MVESQRLDLLEALISTLMSKDLSQAEKAALRVGLEAASARHGGSPIIPTVVEEIFNPSSPVETLEGFRDRQDLMNVGREVGFALQELTRGKLRGLFDGPSTVGFDPAAPMMSINLKNFIQGSQAMSLIMACTGSWFEASLRGDDLGQRNVIYEEAHELMSFPQLLERMRAYFKLVRAWGLRNIIALHRISDLDAVGSLGSKQRSVAEGLLSDTSTRVIYRQEADQLENTQRVLGLSDSSLEAIKKLSIGSGLWQGGVLFVETGQGEALVGVLRALVLHLDAQAACGVRRPDGAARFIDVLPALAACLAALHGNVAARDVARCRQRKDADEPVFAPVLGADAALPNPLNRPRPARGEGGCILALQLNHGGMDAVRATVFTADAGADACRLRFPQQAVADVRGGALAFAWPLRGADL